MHLFGHYLGFLLCCCRFRALDLAQLFGQCAPKGHCAVIWEGVYLQVPRKISLRISWQHSGVAVDFKPYSIVACSPKEGGITRSIFFLFTKGGIIRAEGIFREGVYHPQKSGMLVHGASIQQGVGHDAMKLSHAFRAILILGE